MAKNTGTTRMGYAVILVFMLGCLGAFLAETNGENIYRSFRARHWLTTAGAVLDSRAWRDSAPHNGRTYISEQYYLRYRYAVGNQGYTSEQIACDVSLGRRRAIQESHPVGAPVQVYYDPADPANAYLDTQVTGSSYFWFGNGLLLMAGAAVFIRWVWARNTRRASDAPDETASAKPPPPTRATNSPPTTFLGVVCQLVCVGGFGLIFLQQKYPTFWLNNQHQIRGERMPLWMAVSVAIVFGLAGINLLSKAWLKQGRFAGVIQGLAGVLILGIFAAIPIVCLVQGDDMGGLPFLPARWGHVLGQIALGLLGLMLGGGTLLAFVTTVLKPKTDDSTRTAEERLKGFENSDL